MRLGRMQPGRQTVDHGNQGHHSSHVGPTDRSCEHVATGQGDAPEDDSSGIDPRKALGCVDRGAVVVDLGSQRHSLARSALALTEAAVVEDQRIEACLGECLGEWRQAGVLGAAKPVRHHDDRSPGVRGERVVGSGEQPGRAGGALRGEGEVLGDHRVTFRRCCSARGTSGRRCASRAVARNRASVVRGRDR